MTEQKDPKRSVRIVRRSEGLTEEDEQALGRIAHFQRALFSLTPRVYVTPLIVGANVLWFAFMVVMGVGLFQPSIMGLVKWGANYGPFTIGGEWWRLVSCMFVHIGLLHLMFNMWVLWDLGQLVERLIGPVGFLLMYMISGIVGSMASLVWHQNVVSAGASGAVFGVFGALMASILLRRDTIPSEILKDLRNSGMAFLGLNLLLGFSMKGIDMAAHIGGLGMGFLCGLVLSQPIELGQGVLRRRLSRNLLVSLLGLGVIAGVGYAFWWKL